VGLGLFNFYTANAFGRDKMSKINKLGWVDRDI